MCRSHPIYCILPPHLLQSIGNHGSPLQRLWALKTMAADNTFRSLRAALAAHAAAVVTRRRSVVEEVQKRRTISTARNEETMPGAVVRVEGGPPTGDAAVDEAYDGLGSTFDLYWEVYERNSIDDEGLALDATVHYGTDYNNAFWNGQRMVFGDGDGDLFNRFTIATDVIGHELTHGVVEDEARLVYFFQPGALNESNADVFGSLVKQKLLNQTVQKADWLIGAGLFTRQIQGVALRSMKAPGTAYDDPVLGKDPQPAHMKGFVRTYEDNGGVHINSGIPNHAFYLAAMAIGGYAWEKPGRIWYETLRDSRLRPNAGFQSFAGLTVDNAGRLYGFGSAEQKAVRHGWAEVGIKVSR